MAANDYSNVDLMRALIKAGFKWGSGLGNAFCVSLAENGARDLTAVLVNKENVGLNPSDLGYGSRDRGPFQINDFWHPEVSDAVAFSLDGACKEAYRISRQGASWSQWTTFNSGAYKKYTDLSAAVYDLVICRDNNKALTEERDSLKTQVTALQTQIDTSNRQLSELQVQKATLTNQINQLTTQVAELQAKVAAGANLQTQLDTANAELVLVKSELVSVEANLTAAQTEVKNYKDSITAIRQLQQGIGLS
jgi:lysozyme-like protein